MQFFTTNSPIWFQSQNKFYEKFWFRPGRPGPGGCRDSGNRYRQPASSPRGNGFSVLRIFLTAALRPRSLVASSETPWKPRVRRRFRVVVSGSYWAAVRSMERDLYSLGSPAVGFCLELGSGFIANTGTAPSARIPYSRASPSSGFQVVSLEIPRFPEFVSYFFFHRKKI